MEEIDLKQLLKIFWRRKVLIIVIAIIGMIIGFVYNTFLTTPKYKATATFLLSNSVQNDTGNGKAITQQDITLNSKIINNYTELIKSDAIVNEVTNRYQIFTSKSEIKKGIEVKAKNDSEYVEVSVALPNKEEAAVVANGLLEVLKDKVKELYNMDNVRVVINAQTPTSPCNKNPAKFMAIGGAAGIVVSCLIILVLNIFDDTVKDESDIEDKIGLQVLAKFNKQNHPDSLSWNPKSDYVEGFKVLRTNLQFSKGINDNQIIAVSSILPGAGKSWVTTNLAVAFAKADFKVLIIDADLRKGIQHNKFRVEQKPGLIDAIKRAHDIEDLDSWGRCIKDTSISNIKILPSGGNIMDSSEILLSNKVSKMVEALKQRFDIIIFDSTPSALVADAVVLSRVVDTNILVAEYEKTKIKDLKKLKSDIENVGGHISGAVINKVNNGSSKKSYSYYGNEQGMVNSKRSERE